jgi:high-affinity nickel-transport protein
VRQVLSNIFNDSGRNLPLKVVGLYTILIAANGAAWAWALIAFHHHPVLLGTALLAYSFGLRHAVDADHIATIGGVIGTLVSALFLLAIAAMNIIILAGVYRTFQRVKAGAPYVDDDLNTLLAGRGFFARLFRPMFGLIRRSWHMYPLGFLFGLGFDTATEVGLLGISAAQASQGMSVWSILVFPALFTAGMSLIDTTDSILMLGAYGWAFVKPIRKLYYNMTITFVSVVVALLVGGIEALGLIQDQMDLKGAFWDGIGALNDNFGTIGYLIIGVFVVSWAASAIIYRVRGYDRLEVEAG